MSEQPSIVPFSLRDTPALIERLFPTQKISAEAQKERKAGGGQTLTALGSYWKGRKPLILVRACILAALLPATEDPEADLAILERLLAMDDDAFRRRVKRKSAWPSILGKSYLDRLSECRRPEELDPAVPERAWVEVNQHLGTTATDLQGLTAQLGLMRFGRTPKVGDTFAGGGSIPFEAARLGCDVYAADLNPIACMLTWGGLHILNGSAERRHAAAKSLRDLATNVEADLLALGIETRTNGDRAKAFLYCLEVRCPQTGWMVPLLSTRVISRNRGVVAKLVPDHDNRRFDIEIEELGSDQLDGAGVGTVVDGSLVYTLNDTEYSTSMRTLRGDRGGTNSLRAWERGDVAPREDDVFQERLYCIQWITESSLHSTHPVTWFGAPDEEDLAREGWILDHVHRSLAQWQAEGLVPNMGIDPGEKTDEPMRTRGWRYWHHLFTPRQLLVLSTVARHSSNEEQAIAFTNLVNHASRLCRWTTSNPRVAKDGSGKQVGGASDNPSDVFSNQALNTLYNYANRSFYFQKETLLAEYRNTMPSEVAGQVLPIPAADTRIENDLYITDPPYADAVNYHEITELFTSWLRGRPPKAFERWSWDTRRLLAVRGVGAGFRSAMISAYSAMQHAMPDNGLQVVMFTHTSNEVWADMAQIFWASGLRVMAAWYIATETTSELKKGGYVQGTVLLVLRKRLQAAAGYKNEIVEEIKAEVASQIDTMVGLNQTLKGHGRIENLFEDVDLQMGGYAAALRVLTSYSKIDGRDMTAEALRPRQKGEVGLVGELIEFAVGLANQHMVPEPMTRAVWEKLTAAERFYLKMQDLEEAGAKKLDNYQNFAKVFRVEDFQLLMHSMKPNESRLKRSAELKAAFGDTEFGKSLTRALLHALRELQHEVDGDAVLGSLRELVPDYQTDRRALKEIACYIAEKRKTVDESEAAAARVLHALIHNERLGA